MDQLFDWPYEEIYHWEKEIQPFTIKISFAIDNCFVNAL